jgi:hypothetical protein
MAIALVALSSLFNVWTRTPSTPRTAASARASSAPCATTAAALARPTPRNTPLRVVRLAEDGVRKDCAGRMVMSGRMADICAELDRLTEREARQTLH